MPVKRAAHKALRQNRAARLRNVAAKLHLKKMSIQLRKAIAAKNPEQIKSLAAAYVKALDRAAQKRIVHHNVASRKKSRLAARVRKALA